jgi:L-arabinokinase
MHRTVESTAPDRNHPVDLLDFIQTLRTPGRGSNPATFRLFDQQREIVISRAPGRLDVMGGIADYSGSLVLEMPIREATLVALQRDPLRRIRILSSLQEPGVDPVFEMALADLEAPEGPIDYETGRARFQRHKTQRWAAYVGGVFLVLMRERGISFTDGARILIESRVPPGKGVSSSAALEVATMQAVCGAFGLSIEPQEIALLCQKVENLVVGAPCGIMDQMTAAVGEAGSLLMLLCQPAELIGTVVIPDDIEFWGIDSGVRHSVAGADYGSVRTGTFMGYRVIAELAGLRVNTTSTPGRVEIDDPRWLGYLANLTLPEFESYAAELPERMRGAEFLSAYGGTTDHVTRVDPECDYAVRTPTAHAVYESDRVRAYGQLIEDAPSEPGREFLGWLMYQSHASYSACGLGSSKTDRLVELVREAGPAQGLFGARITGGGSGGTVAVLGRRGAASAIAGVTARFAEETGYHPYLFAGSSPGSASVGCVRLNARG